MGNAGRPPKPTGLKRLHGNPGKRKLNAAEPKPDVSLPSCPTWLSGEAKAEWKRVAKSLHECGLLTAVDRAALAGYCQAWARWSEAEAAIEREGRVLMSAKGSPYLNPELVAASMALKEVLAFATQLGMTPSARTRIKVDPPKKDKSLADILFERSNA